MMSLVNLSRTRTLNDPSSSFAGPDPVEMKRNIESICRFLKFSAISNAHFFYFQGSADRSRAAEKTGPTFNGTRSIWGRFQFRQSLLVGVYVLGQELVLVLDKLVGPIQLCCIPVTLLRLSQACGKILVQIPCHAMPVG